MYKSFSSNKVFGGSLKKNNKSKKSSGNSDCLECQICQKLDHKAIQCFQLKVILLGRSNFVYGTTLITTHSNTPTFDHNKLLDNGATYHLISDGEALS